MQIIPIDQIRTDGGTQSRAAIDPDTVSEYAEAIAAGAVLPQPVVFFDGAAYWLADGFHRLAAHRQAGYPNVSTDVRQGDRREAILYSVAANAAHGLRRTPADKRRAVETLLRDDAWASWSDREIGRRCCVDGKFVASVRASICGQPQMSERLVERGGTTYTMAVPQRSRQEEDPASVLTPARDDWTPDEAPAVRRNDPASLGSLMGRSSQALAEAPVAPIAPKEKPSDRTHNEWYTPAGDIALVKAVLGEICLDPASCAMANAVVGATAFYTLERDEDGLELPWTVPTLYTNPPYDDTATWINRLVAEYHAGAFNEAIALVLAKTETEWFDLAWEYGSVCIVRSRISHVAGDGGKEQTGRAGSAFFYFGHNHKRFAEVFAHRGRVQPPTPWAARPADKALPQFAAAASA